MHETNPTVKQTAADGNRRVNRTRPSKCGHINASFKSPADGSQVFHASQLYWCDTAALAAFLTWLVTKTERP